jgi:phage gp36-like protein
MTTTASRFTAYETPLAQAKPAVLTRHVCDVRYSVQTRTVTVRTSYHQPLRLVLEVQPPFPVSEGDFRRGSASPQGSR